MNNKFIDEHQHILKQILVNLKKKGAFPHAFLLKGTPDDSTLLIAKYIACFIVCENEEPCLTCRKCSSIINEQEVDLIILDGSKNIIKKEDILKIQSRFSKSSIGENSKKIYIINQSENMNQHSSNSLLKFLEEPSDDCFAILTTQNIDAVPKTIVSRSMVLGIQKEPKNNLITQTLTSGLPLEDTLILSSIFSNKDDILNKYNHSSYKHFKNIAIEIIEKTLEKEDILFFAKNELSAHLNSKEEIFFFLKIFLLLIKDILNSDYEEKLLFKNNIKTIIKAKKEIPFLDKKLVYLLKYKERVFSNTNLSLLLDCIFITFSSLEGEV